MKTLKSFAEKHNLIIVKIEYHNNGTIKTGYDLVRKHNDVDGLYVSVFSLEPSFYENSAKWLVNTNDCYENFLAQRISADVLNRINLFSEKYCLMKSDTVLKNRIN